MNCAQFHRRMQTRLDNRLALNSDPQLVGHSNTCEACRSYLQTWQSIEKVIGPAVGIKQARIGPPADRRAGFGG